ncbi:MAG: SDR family oxidoreductase [Dehalococcoidia bacterium]|jgi:NAD(P)-dependent dehydrogenase (short-subunit alcohol dehydrogenase family)
MPVEGFDLTGKKALVIGAESSVGRAIALALKEADAEVAVTSARKDAADNGAAEETARLLGGAAARSIDATSASQVNEAIDEAFRRMGRLDILVTCPDLFLAKPAGDISDAEWEKVFAVNLSSVFFACRAAGPRMAKQGYGRIINVASGLGERGLPNCSAYCAVKGGVFNLTRALAQEWAAAGVTVNVIAPGWLEDTPGLGDPDPQTNRLLRYIPMRRAGRADEVGPLAVYVASDSAGYLTGRTLFVDGGLTAHL